MIMAAAIDMSLDEIIRNNKRSTAGTAAAHRHARARPYGPRPDRRFAIRNPSRTTPYEVPQPRQFSQPMLSEMDLVRGPAEAGTKLYISNLDYGVSNEDIKLLFSEVGELQRYAIHYDKSGRSKGTAEVVFRKQSDALAAIKKYDNMRLDGKPLKIELVSPAVLPPFQNSLLRRPNDVLESERGRFGSSRFHNGIARSRLPRHLVEEKGHARKVSVRDLDAELERYHLEAMQINKKNEN